MTIVQLSDLHIGARTAGDPAGDLAAAVRAVNALHARGGDIGAVLVTGDLVNDGTPAQYAEVRALLGALTPPVLVLPGNHDDRAALRAAFPLADDPAGGDPERPYRWARTVGDLRIVACDTLIPGTDDGACDAESRAWLAARLGEDTRTPTLLAMHHPPLLVGLAQLDAMAPAAADRAALGALLAEHPQVRRVACGHVHLAAAGLVGRTPVLTAPSTWRAQSALDLAAELVRIVDGPAGLVVHTLLEGELVSHVRPVDAA